MDLGGLGHGIRQRTATGPDARETGDRDERAAALGLLQVRLGRVQQPQVALDIDVEALVPVVLVDLLVEIEEIRQPRPARVADDDVQPAELLHRLGHEPLDLGLLLDVCLDRVEPRLCCIRQGVCCGDLRRFLDHLVGLLPPRVVIHHDAEMCGERFDGRGTQARAGCCDECDFD